MRAAPAIIIAAFLLTTGFTDKVGKFSINFPKGWSAPKADGNLTSVTAPEGGTNCNAYATAKPDLATYTQAQINEAYGKPMDAAGWADFLGKKTPEIEVSEVEVRPVAGAILQVATIRVQTDDKNSSAVMARIGFIVLPGAILDAGCYAAPSNWDSAKPVLEKTISSLRPLKK